jgi:aspartyl protease family protein
MAEFRPDPRRSGGPWRSRGGGARRVWLWLAAAGVALLAVIAFLVTSYPEALALEGDRMRFVFWVMWAAVIGSSLILAMRARPVLMLRYAAFWLALGAVIVVAYSFRYEARAIAERVLAELMPFRGEAGAHSITLSARSDGHFVAEADVDGVKVRFLVDTGATDVVLSPGDARRLGLFRDGDLRFNQPVQTANGVAFGAPVRLGRIAIGPVVVTNVAAAVNGAEMSNSLLGMSFLGRISSYEVNGGRLTLRQ